MFTDQQKAELGKPLSSANIKKNPRGFNYVEGWHAIAEANRIFGFDGWDRQTIDMRQLGEPEQVNGNWRVAYHCRVRITVRAKDREIIRDGSGYGSGIVKDIRDAHESAIKEAETDAMKRALMTFGNPFGLALYDKARTNVEDDTPRKPTTKPDRITTGPQPKLSDAAKDFMAKIDLCKTTKAFDTYIGTIKAGLDALSDDEYNMVYDHGQSKLKALKQAENLAA